MKFIVSGAGIAGLTLAYCLRRGQHQVMVVEKSASLRDEGSMIDFFGSGYDASEEMGLLPELERLHYPIAQLEFLDAEGRERYSIPYAAMRRLFDGRHFNFMRGDLERLLDSEVGASIDLRYGTQVDSFRDDGQRVIVAFSDGTTDHADLLVGADGVHSRVRALAYGGEEQFSRFLGYRAASFVLSEPPPGLRNTEAFYTMSVPGRQVGVYPIRGGRLATFFVYKSGRPVDDRAPEAAVDELRNVYGRLGWIVPELLERCDPSTLYFDSVSQIEVPEWRRGRVVLVGDACQCVSLIAGQGASLAMAGAYVLAEELTTTGTPVSGALARYEDRVRPCVVRTQQAARRLARWFVPEDRPRLFIRDALMRMATWPVVWRLLRHSLAPERITQR